MACLCAVWLWAVFEFQTSLKNIKTVTVGGYICTIFRWSFYRKAEKRRRSARAWEIPMAAASLTSTVYSKNPYGHEISSVG